MKCPKCGFNSFEFHDTCRKCGKDLGAFKASFNIRPLVIPPPKGVPPPRFDAAAGTEDAAAPGAAAFESATPAGAPEPDDLLPPVEMQRPPAPPLDELEEFTFDDTPFELPRHPAPREALTPRDPRNDPPHPGPARGDFSLDDFIHFGELNSGKKEEEEPAPYQEKGGMELEDLFPSEPHPVDEGGTELSPHRQGKKKEEKKGLEWLE